MTRQEVLAWLEKKFEAADGIYEGFFEDQVIAELIEDFKRDFPENG